MILGSDYIPVVKYGKPDVRDGQGTYELFWDEEIKRINNGYTPPGGSWIPGAYYFYLNHCTIRGFPDEGKGRSSKPIPMKPLYRDGDHEFFNHIYECRRDSYGAIFPKGRRRGYSWMAVATAVHEFITSVAGQMAVGSEGESNKGYVKEFRTKFDIMYSGLPPELRPSLGLENNQEMLRTGWSETVNGETTEYGLMNIIHWTNFNNPGKLRGLQLSLGIWEEAGEIQKLLKSYLDTVDCFKEGDWMFGFPMIGGTSNKIRHDSTDFQEMCNNAEKYRLRPLFMNAYTCFYPMYDRLTGISDKEGAKQLHSNNLEKLKVKDGQGSNLAYWQYRQEYPQEWSDLWLTYGTATFNLELINDQIAYLSTSKKAMEGVERGELEWPVNAKGEIQEGDMPIWVPSDKGMLVKTADHLPHLKNAHTMGFDPYFVDDSVNGGNRKKDVEASRAAAVVRRRFISPSILGEMPAMTYYDRPYEKETAYMYAWKMAVYYDTQILAETGDDMFFKFFIDRGITKYLKPRPLSAESPYSQSQNRFGVDMRGYQKNLGEGLADQDIKRNISNHRNIQLLKELAMYGTVNTDLAMAYILSLIHDYDLSRFMVTEKQEEVGSNLMRIGFTEINGRIVSNFEAEASNRGGTGERRSFDDRFKFGY